MIGNLTSGVGEQKKLFILIYHRVLNEPDFMRPGELDVKKFTWQMELLSKYFNVLPLDIALNKLQSNTLPSRAVAITFDDGYADNLLNAVPILKTYNLPATFFIATGFLDGGLMWNDSIIESIRQIPEKKLDLSSIKEGVHDLSSRENRVKVAGYLIDKLKHLEFSQRDKYTKYVSKLAPELPDNLMLTTTQLKILHGNNMEIGGHTVSHPILAKIDDRAAKEEIVENKKKLRDILGIEPRFFAYPNGKAGKDYLPRHVEMIKELNYQAALSTQWGVSRKNSDIWQLPRFTPWDDTPVKFLSRMLYMYNKG